MSIYWKVPVLDKPTHKKPERRVNELEREGTQCRVARQALEGSNERIGNILESISDGFFALDDDMVVTYFNTAAEKLLGRKSADVLGRRLFEAFLEAKGSIFEEQYTLALRERRHLSFETYFGVKPYENWYEVRVYPYEDGISVYFQVTSERKRTEQALRKSEETARALLNAPTESALLMDARGTILALNATTQQRLGKAVKNLIGANIYDLLPPGLAGDRKARIDEVFRTGDPVSFEDERDGRYSENSIYPVFDAHGGVERVAVFSRDVTDRKQAEESLRRSEEQYRRIVNTAQEGIWIVDAEARVNYLNKRLADMLGYDMEEILGHYLFDFTDDLAPAGVGQSLEGDKHRMTGQHDFRFRRRDGSEMWGMVSSSPMFNENGQFVGALGMIIDVTERRQAEEALRKSSEQIKLFAYSVSHDLKGPAIGLHGVTRLLVRYYQDLLDERGEKYCEQILEATEQIVALVDNINLYIATKEVPLKIDNVALGEVLQMVRNEFSTQLALRQVRWLQPEDVPEIRVDRLSVLRILRNLVDNALKYAGNGLTEVKIGYEASDQFHTLSVSDDGIGVKKEYAEKIFGLFERNQTSRSTEGTGLGLAIVRELAHRHGGTVWAEPGRKGGTVFNVSISRHL